MASCDPLQTWSVGAIFTHTVSQHTAEIQYLLEGRLHVLVPQFLHLASWLLWLLLMGSC